MGLLLRIIKCYETIITSLLPVITVITYYSLSNLQMMAVKGRAMKGLGAAERPEPKGTGAAAAITCCRLYEWTGVTSRWKTGGSLRSNVQALVARTCRCN